MHACMHTYIYKYIYIYIYYIYIYIYSYTVNQHSGDFLSRGLRAKLTNPSREPHVYRFLAWDKGGGGRGEDGRGEVGGGGHERACTDGEKSNEKYSISYSIDRVGFF